MEKEKPRLFAFTEVNIIERSEREIRKCTDFDIYSAAYDPLPFILDIIQTPQLAPTGDPLIDSDVAMQAYHTMKQQPGEPAWFKRTYSATASDEISEILGSY